MVVLYVNSLRKYIRSQVLLRSFNYFAVYFGILLASGTAQIAAKLTVYCRSPQYAIVQPIVGDNEADTQYKVKVRNCLL